MLKKLLLRLDNSGWPQRIVGWVNRRRKKSPLLLRLREHSSAATYAVGLSVASPMIATKDLFNAVVPSQFGSWREFRVCKSLVAGEQAVAVLKELRSGTEFTLVMPVHLEFPRRELLSTRRLRLTCEAARAHLVTVRTPDGVLIAAGTLEPAPQAAYSWEAV